SWFANPDPLFFNTFPTRRSSDLAVNCWDEFVFNTTTCEWENIGVQDPEPTVVNCWDEYVFNEETCAWENIGVQDPEPTAVNCWRSEEHTSELQSRENLVCRLLLE